MAPDTILLAILWLSLTLYVLLAGADFGAGIWEVNIGILGSENERTLIDRAIGPVWEANHVWLIFVMVCLHSAFPVAFAALSRALWLPLLLALVGIVFRGAAFALRAYAVGALRQQAVLGALFALASTAAPFFLGAAAGAVASGRLDVTPLGGFSGNHLTDWISPLAVFNGVFTVGICAYLAAVYLVREAHQARDAALVQRWRQRALGMGAGLGVLALAGLVFLAREPASVWDGFRERAWPLVALAIVAGYVSLWELTRKHFTTAVLSAGATVTCILWGWGVAQYPFLIPPTISVEEAKGPDSVLWAMIIGISVGMPLLLPSLWFLFALFKRAAPRGSSRA